MNKQDHDRKHDRDAGRFPPVPWVDLAAAAPSAGPTDVEHRIGALFAKVPVPVEFTAAAQARVGARLRASARGPARAWFRPRVVVGWALGAVVLLVSGAVIAGGGVGQLWERLKPRMDALLASGGREVPREWSLPTRGSRADLPTREVAAPTDVPPAPLQTTPSQTTDEVRAPVEGEPAPALRQRPRPPRQRQREGEPPARTRRRATGARYAGTEGRAAVSAPVSPPEAARLALPDSPGEKPRPVGPPIADALAPSPASSWAPAAEPPPSPARRAAAEASPVAPPSQLSQEARLLNQAMVQLRQHRDGAAALATLNEYLARYPQGTLAGEARGARIDALLLLQRKGEALKALDATRLEPVGRGQELLVIRGELRARRDCGAAVRDFELVLGRAAPAPLQERALYGRAVCRHRQGDEQGASADAATYLARFPDGRFAPAVRRLGTADNGRSP